jgi:hypothetical protein
MTESQPQPPTQPQPRPAAALSPFTIHQPNPEEHYLKLLIYGPYGVGKTVLAGTAADVPAMRDVLYIDAEAGELSLSDRPTLDIIRIDKYAQLARIYEYLRLHVRARDAGDTAKLLELESRVRGREVTTPTVYRTVVIDSLTELQRYLMYQLLGVQPEKQPLDIPLAPPEWGEWRQSSDMIQLLVRQFRDLPMHVIIVAGELEVEDDRKRQLKRISLPGKLSVGVEGFFDLVGHLQKAKDGDGKTIYRLYLDSATDSRHAKNRFRNIVVEYVDSPTIGKLIELDRLDKEKASNGSAAAAASSQSRPAARAAGTPARGAGAAVRPVQRAGS